jgi:hypothetical protein
VPLRGVAEDVGVDAGGEARVGVTEVFGDLVEGAPFVDKERRAGVAQVVWPEVGDVGGRKGRDPDPLAPVVATEMFAFGVGEGERRAVGTAACKVELGQVPPYRPEEFWLPDASRLRRRDAPLNCATPPKSQSVIPSISSPSRRACHACPSS